MKTGDYVGYSIPGYGSDTGGSGYGFIIGEPHYSEKGSHVVIGDEQVHGMPIHSGHCRVISSGKDVSAWTDRYNRRYPNFLKPCLTKGTSSR